MPSGVPLAKRPYVTAKDLANIPVIMPSRQKVFDEVANWFGDYYERLNISGASNLSTNAALLVRAGIGIPSRILEKDAPVPVYRLDSMSGSTRTGSLLQTQTS